MELLNDMALFVEVVNAKGFRHAAEIIGIPNSTVSRRIANLEKAIGLRLLHRTTRKIELTEAGQRYYERCKRIVNEAKLAHQELDSMLAQPTGVLRASLPVDFATIYLAPIIANFSRLYPGIRFELNLSPRVVDLVSEPYDVAIRMGNSADSHLIARKLAVLPCYFFASSGYIEQFGEPMTPTDLLKHHCLGFGTATESLWKLIRKDATLEVPVNLRFQVNSMGMIRNLAVLDMGIAVLPAGMVAEDIENGTLKRVLVQWESTPTPVYAMTETRLLPAKTQRFIEFLKAHLGKEDKKIY